MKLEQLYEMQKALDARIIKDKGLEGQDLLPNTVLALQVEIGELANEWRVFKHWSNDREPRREVKCHACRARGYFEFGEGAEKEPCTYCEGTGIQERDPLLEEYVDCLHFFLSIARQIDLPAEELYVWEDQAEGETSVLFSDILINVGLILGDRILVNAPTDNAKWQREHLRSALFVFYALGEQRLGLTYEEIAEAYVAKNRTNHDRQANGY